MTCAEPVIGCELNALPVSETSCTEVVCGEWVAEDWNQVWDHNRFTPKVHSGVFFQCDTNKHCCYGIYQGSCFKYFENMCFYELITICVLFS